MSKKIIAVLLAAVLSFSVFTLPASAAAGDIGEKIENGFYTVLEKAVMGLLFCINKTIPGYSSKWISEKDYDSKDFYPGESKFDTQEGDGAVWSLGYAGASLIDGLDVMNGEYFLAGSLEVFKGRVPVEVTDDQRVRVFALSDGSDVFVQAVVDGFGLSRKDVNIIRERVKDTAYANGVTSLNVSVLHQHSCIDTLGFNVPLLPALIFNSANSLFFGTLEKLKQKRNAEFIENLYSKTAQCITAALSSMKEGRLYYGEADIGEYIRDKRTPYFYDEMIHRLRFVPSDGSEETWILEAGIHATNFGAAADVLTADYPYYLEKTIREDKGANTVFVQGAELAIATDRTLTDVEELSTKENVELYAKAIADRVYATENELELKPILNVSHKEVKIKIENQIHILAAKEDLLSAVVVKDGFNVKMVTEIGYLELGGKVAVFICPGEFEAGLIYDGPVTTKEESRTGEGWDYEALEKKTGMEYVMVFGICNDQSGYVMTDNAYRSLFTENEEANVLSRTIGSTYMKEYASLIESVK